MTKEYPHQSFSSRLRTLSRNYKFQSREAIPHPALFPYLATEMGSDLWDIQIIADEKLEKMELKARERMWQSRNVCYLVTEQKSAVAFAPNFTNGTRTGRPHGGWILRVSCAEGVDEERKTQAEELAANVAGQLGENPWPTMILEEPGQGVQLSFYTVIIKMSSLLDKRWGWHAFLNDCLGMGHSPVTDGQLVAVSDMSSAGLDELIKALREHEFQNEEYPVDFYLADADPILAGLFGDEARPEIFEGGRSLDRNFIVSPHDHHIRLFLRKEGRIWARLEVGR